MVVLLAIGMLGFNHVLDLRAEEGRRAIVTIEMMETGNYIVPSLHAHTYYNKPPLFNWLVALFYQLFGSTAEWVLRLPGVLSLFVSAWVFYRFLKKYLNPKTASLLACAGLCAGDLLFYGSVNAGEIDLFYSLLVVLQVLSIFHFYEQRKWWSLFLWSYLFMAAGILTKGLPSIAFQALTLVPFLLVKREWKKLFHPAHFIGAGICFALCAGYFYLYAQQEDVVAYMLNLFKQASQRTASEHTLTETLLGLLDFPGYLLGKLMPWPLFAMFLFFKPVRKTLSANRAVRFTVLFFFCNIWIYWMSPEMRIRYLYMFFPFLSFIFLEAALTETSTSEKLWSWVKKILMGIMVIAGFATIALAGLNASVSIEGIPAFEPNMFVVLVAFGLVAFSIAWLLRKSTTRLQVFWSLLLLLAVTRIAFDLVVLPLTNADQKHRNYTAELMELANGEDIYIYGTQRLTPSASLFGTSFAERKLTVPSELPYQVPYYYYQETGKVMAHAYEKKSGALYFGYSALADESDEVLHRNHEVYPAVELVLYRTPSLLE